LNVWGSTPDQANLTFATYEIPSGNPYITYTYSENDALVVVKLKDSVSNKVGLGSYVSNKDAKLRVVEANVSSKNLAGGVFDKNGTLEFAVFGPKYACGTMKFDDGYSLLKGEFIAEIVNK
jgi:hypothetical protein